MPLHLCFNLRFFSIWLRWPWPICVLLWSSFSQRHLNKTLKLLSFPICQQINVYKGQPNLPIEEHCIWYKHAFSGQLFIMVTIQRNIYIHDYLYIQNKNKVNDHYVNKMEDGPYGVTTFDRHSSRLDTLVGRPFIILG